jgi:valyl-tRNA synthetase
VRRRLERELAELYATRQRLDAKLASQFSARAPDAVVTRERERLAATVRRLELLRRTMAD